VGVFFLNTVYMVFDYWNVVGLVYWFWLLLLLFATDSID